MSKDPTNQKADPTTGGKDGPRGPSAPDTPSVLEPPDGGLDDDMDRANNRGLPSRNIVVDGKRTSIRLDTYSLNLLNEIAEREHLSVNEICTLVHARNKGMGFSLTAAIRVFMLSYYRKAATEEGHRLAGHGSGHPVSGPPFDAPHLAGDEAADDEGGGLKGCRRTIKSLPPALSQPGRPLHHHDRTSVIEDSVAN